VKNNNEKSKVKDNIKKGIKNSIKYILAITAILFLLYRFFPEQIISAIDISQRYGIEMITIFPAVLILMGLADVWVPKSLINKYLGKNSGLKGIFISIFLGTLPTGPLYIAFPIAAELLRKKARISNVMIFLGVWASLKIPQISVEIKFLGIKFAIIRFIFTLISIILIGYLIELLVEKSEVKA
jgi:uncharacterized membrane protein YraQ (UPF0718 family)